MSKFFEDDKLHEECGVIGAVSSGTDSLASRMCFGLISLQHRGQESAGLVTFCEDQMKIVRDQGLVQEVFNEQNLAKLCGNIGVAHVRYATQETNSKKNVQPYMFKYKGSSIAYSTNGNIVNSKRLRAELEDEGIIFLTDSDSEVVGHLLAKHWDLGAVEALKAIGNIIRGAFAISLAIDDKLYAMRDPHGIRPLVLGQFEDGYVIASETVAFDAMGAKLIRDVEAGELIVIDANGYESVRYSDETKIAHSAFEYVYFARPDSVIDGKSVYKTRLKAGKILAKNYPVDADIVIPVPDSGRSAAIGYADQSGLRYGEGLIKNKYVGRTFIQPTQELRELALKMKLNVLKEIVMDKRVVLVDDSIVRGTTSRKIVTMLKNAGAKEVHLRVSSPLVKYPSFYGIDTPSASELVASYMTKDEIRDMVGADSLEFLTVDELVESIGFQRDELCLDVFTGVYPVSLDF
ncbi:MAG: amidophosphoribosyltransferase [Bacillota bacterium]|nr:amidophosphoribosyltransferase [Bacillota bacterium]